MLRTVVANRYIRSTVTCCEPLYKVKMSTLKEPMPPCSHERGLVLGARMNPNPSCFNPKPQTLNPKPQTLNLFGVSFLITHFC